MEVDRMMEIDDIDDPGLLPLYPLPDFNIPSCSKGFPNKGDMF